MEQSAVSKVATAAALLLVLVAVPAVFAEDYDVGDDSGWTQGVDYSAWARGKTFRVGDILEFKYGPTHTVDIVGKAGYDNCDASGAQTFSGGDTNIRLNTTGPIYIICGTPGHCDNGMKLTVTVQASSGPTTPSPPTTPGTPSTPRSPSPPSSTPGSPSTPPATPPPPPSAASRGVMSYLVMGVSVVLGYGVWIMG